MGILRHITTALLLLSLASCYSDFEPDIKSEPVLCLNSCITAGMPIEVSVTRTWLYSEPNGQHNNAVKDASVTITANGERVPADYLPHEGDIIRIEAESPTYGTAWAEVEVPRKVEFTKTDTQINEGNTFVGETEDGLVTDWLSFGLRASVGIKDDPTRDNYFRVGSYGHNPSGDLWPETDIYLGLGSLRYEAEPIFGEHIGVFESIMGSSESATAFFTDRQFMGSTYNLTLLYNDFFYLVNTPELDPAMTDCGFTIMVYNISKSFYDWYLYLYNQNEGPYGDFGGLGLGDPMWGYSNVSTGAGIVVAQTPSVIEVDFGPYIREALM